MSNYSFPDVGIRAVTIRAKNIVSSSASPFTGQQQVFKHQGEWWEMEVTLPAMKRDDAEQVAAFLVSLQGQYNTFNLGDKANTAPRGVGTGTPVVNGGSQTGYALDTTGWTSSTTGILKAGDWIQLGSGASSRLYKVLSDANSDGNGDAQLSIWPRLRSSPSDGASIAVNDTVGTWRLSSNEINYSIDEASVYGITFACREVL